MKGHQSAFFVKKHNPPLQVNNRVSIQSGDIVDHIDHK